MNWRHSVRVRLRPASWHALASQEEGRRSQKIRLPSALLVSGNLTLRQV